MEEAIVIVSSAKIPILPLVLGGISKVKSEESRGDGTEPWGTPAVMGLKLDKASSNIIPNSPYSLILYRLS